MPRMVGAEVRTGKRHLGEGRDNQVTHLRASATVIGAAIPSVGGPSERLRGSVLVHPFFTEVLFV